MTAMASGVTTSFASCASKTCSSGPTSFAMSNVYARTEQPTVLTPRRNPMPPNFATEVWICFAALSVSVIATRRSYRSSRDRTRLDRRGPLVAQLHELDRCPGLALLLLGDERRELHRAQVLEDVLVQARPQIVGDALLVVVAVLFPAALGRVDRL